MNSETPKTYLFKPTPHHISFTLPLYFTTYPIESEETDSVNSVDSNDTRNKQDKQSTLSKLSIDFHLFFDILTNKNLHFPFEQLNDQNAWTYIDDESFQNGPFSSTHMNRLFQEDKFLENFRFKRNDEPQFVPFDQILKRYYKKMYPNKLTVEIPAPVFLEKTKSEIIGKTPEKPQNRIVRDLRFLSDQVRPNFNFQTNSGKGEVDHCEDEELLETRGRSITMN